jgi:hypothetical protein
MSGSDVMEPCPISAPGDGDDAVGRDAHPGRPARIYPLFTILAEGIAAPFLKQFNASSMVGKASMCIRSTRSGAQHLRNAYLLDKSTERNELELLGDVGDPQEQA